MGNHRAKGSKSARTGAPLTRRQQKQQRHAPKQQRQAQTMPPAQQELRHQPQMRVAPRPEDTPQPAVRRDAGAVAAPASDEIGDEEVTSMIVDIEAEATDEATDNEVVAAQSTHDEATPPRSHNPRVATHSTADVSAESPSTNATGSTESLEEESATTPTTPVARTRPTRQTTKYPTLARMAAIAPTAPSANATPPPSATHAHAADVEETDTLETPSPSPSPTPEALRTGYTERPGDTDARHAIARDSATDTGEERAIFEPRKPVTTRRLAETAYPASFASAASEATARRLEASAAKAAAGAREAHRQAAQASKTTGVKRPQALPEVDLVLPVAAGHIVVAFAAVLTGTILLLVGQQGAYWPFSLGIVLGVGAWLAYVVSQRSTAKGFAGGALLVSQIAALGWMFALLGARASLMTLAPAMLLLALRTSGRLTMTLGAGAVFALYVAAELFASTLPFSQPVLSPTELAVTDGVVVFVGIFTMLVMALDLQHGRIRALAHSRASRHEARLLRERTTLLRQQLEEDAALLDERLGEALHGRGIDPVALEQIDNMLSPLVERVIAVAGRLETLQRDREDRLRLEGAVRQVTRALERGWLGLPWSWPDASETLLDELVALLRAPNPRQMPLWREETPPALVPIPTLDTGLTPRPWATMDTPAVNPYVRHDARAGLPALTNRPSLPDHSAHRALSTYGASGMGWPAPTSGDIVAQQPEPQPAYARANPLPWEEWDTWGTWDAAGRDE